MKVAEVRGALLNAATVAGLTVHEYSPAEVKSAVAGWGGADKKQITRVGRLLGSRARVSMTVFSAVIT